jgi:hypothetical protein
VRSESTFRRTLQRLDADVLDELAGQWAARRTTPAAKQRRVIAVDGKTLRGSEHGSDHSRHLLAALDHGYGVVLGQVDVGAKTNEIPLFTILLDQLAALPWRDRSQSAPLPARASWPACATWPSPSCGCPGRPAWPPPCATLPGSPAGHSERL